MQPNHTRTDPPFTVPDGVPSAEQRVVLPVALGADSYEIHVGSGLLEEVGQLYPTRVGARAMIVSSATVGRLYGEVCLSSLCAAGWRAELVLVPDGEQSKTWAQAGELHGACIQAGLDRGSVLFALGGGVIGDLAGFVAATYMRGVPFVQIPTTLLAQVDASVGGKTAVDLPAGKNLVGAFHQPALVVIDVDTLRTLPERDLLAGMAEVIKHAAIADAALFTYLGRVAAELQAGEPTVLRQIVARNCQIKAAVVSADPHEHGIRAWLNYGHTVGHAIEAAAGQWDLRHGEAVAYGIVAEARLAAQLGLSTAEVAVAQEALLASYGLAQGRLRVDFAKAREALLHDKKIVSGKLRLPLVPELGSVTLCEDVPVEALVGAVEALVCA